MELDHNDNVDLEKNVNDADQGKEDQVAYSSYSRVVGKNKLVMKENHELKSELESLRNEKLEASGQKDELIATLKDQVSKLRDDLKTTKNDFAFKSVESSIMDELKMQGCRKPELIINNLGRNALGELVSTIDQNYNVDKDTLREVVQGARSQYGDIEGLFSNRTVNHTPVTSTNFNAPKPKGIGEMSKEELIAHAKRLDAQGKLD